MVKEWEKWREVAKPRLEKLGLPETPESIEQVIPDLKGDVGSKTT